MDKIIFMDAEFTGLSAHGIQFLSIALIKEDTGEEMYLELDVPIKEIEDDWVHQNVIPYLTQEKVPQEIAVQKIRDFVGEDKPYMVADVNQFDWMGICGMFGVWDVPFFYIPIDFASILFAKAINPDVNREKYAEQLGIDVSKYKKHHALHDARILKKMYEILCP